MALDAAASASNAPMSFIERVKVLGSNALLGVFVQKGGFDSCLRGMKVERVSIGLCYVYQKISCRPRPPVSVSLSLSLYIYIYIYIRSKQGKFYVL